MSVQLASWVRPLRRTGLALAWIPVLIALAPLAARPEDLTSIEEGPVEEMIVVGEQPTPLDSLPGASTSVVEIDDRLTEGLQIDDLLAEMPGVQVRRFGGVGDRFEISIRGSRPEQVPVYLDGIRLDTSLTGRSDLSTLCADVLQEIQVTRGPGAARAGSGAIGGVVNLVSRGAPPTPETRLRVAGGSFGTVEGSVRHARRFESGEASLSYCGFRTDGDYEFQRARAIVDGQPIGSANIEERINNDAVRHTGLAQGGLRVGEGALRITQLVSDLDRGSPGSERDQRVDAREKNLSSLTSLAFEHPVADWPGGHFETLLAHRYERNQYRDPNAFLGREPIDTRTEVHNSYLRSSVGALLDAFSGQHEVTFLVEGRHDRLESNEANEKSRSGVAARLELESGWWEGRVRVSPSLRMEYVNGFGVEWVPSLLTSVDVFDWLELHGAVARSYRVPSFQELYLPDKGFERGNEDLEPETSWSGEIGVRLVSPFDVPWLEGEIEATWFGGQVEDSIAFQLISPNVSAPVNTGPSDTRGYELTARWRPHPWIGLSGSRTVTHAELDSDGSQVTGVAVSQADGRLELGPRERLKLVGEVHYTGRIPVYPGGVAEIPSRTSYDASLSIDLIQFPILHLERLGKSLWLSLRGQNLGNVSIRDTRFYPQPGRNFSIALESVF